jgi:diguanylate cyclase (GGDEF)-like protein/PAS domain S-box-containing protein
VTLSAAHGSGVTDDDFRVIAESIPHIVWLAAPDGSTRYCNAHGRLYTGQAATTSYFGDGAALLHPDDTERAQLAWQQAARLGAPYGLDVRIRRFDGTYRWHSLEARPIRGADGDVVSWVGTAADIDDATQREAELRPADRVTAQARALLETLESSAPVGFGFIDRDLRIVHINETLATVNDSTVAEAVGQLACDYSPETWPESEPLYRHIFDSGEAVLDVEDDGPTIAEPDQIRHWLTSYYPVSSDDEVIGIGIVVIDITERKRLEQVRQRLSAIVDGSGNAIFSTTTDAVILTWNAAAERLFGYSASEAIGQTASIIAPPELVHEQTEMRARLNAGGPPELLETTRRHKDGRALDVLITVSTAVDDAGNVMGLSVIAYDISRRREAVRDLEASQRRLAESQRIARLGSFEFDVGTDQMVWSDELYRLLGLDPGLTATHELFVSRVHPDDRPAVTQAWDDGTERGQPFDLLCRLTLDDSKQRWVHARGVAEVAADGTVTKLAGTIRDNTERVEGDRVRHAAESMFEIGFEQAGIGVALIGLDGVPIRVNPAVCALLGRPAEELVGRLWTEYNHPEDGSPGPGIWAQVAAGHDSYEDERRYVRPDGSVVWAMTYVTLVRDEAGAPQHLLAQLLDITERKHMERTLSEQALHDSLTGLPNRAHLAERLRDGLATARVNGTHLGVIFLDVDHFKVINDSLGHTSGDDLLRHAADRITGAIRPGDTVARFGGDEFVIVCEDVSVATTTLIAANALEALGELCVIGNQEMNVTASVGIAIADENSTPESLLRDSDAAMYRAKDRGRGRIEVYDDILKGKAELRLATASALGHALERKQFSVHYQPIVDLSTGAMVSAEALLRWKHPQRGMISPAEFIPVAEETDLILGIGAWVLEQACQELVVWQRTQRDLSVAVNLSVRQLAAPDIAELVKDVVSRTGADPEHLCLELTESLFMEDVDYFAKTMNSLKALGVRLSIDDFGTGYSSLSYLKRFPVDAVKVDRSFVDGLGSDPNDSALVAGIIAMADALGLDVIAEGVETQDQLDNLKRLDCRSAQGFYLARPMPADVFRRLVTEDFRWPVG